MTRPPTPRLQILAALVTSALVAGCGGSTDLGSSSAALTSTGKLRFAVWGDTRPPLPDDIWGYPSDVVTSVFQQIQSANAQFAVGTGDYLFGGGDWWVGQQLDMLDAAESTFTGPVYHTMGNHECSAWGITASNCPRADESSGMRAFMTRLLPAGVSTPYYRVDMDTPLGKAKFLFVAANAWTQAQASWLQQQLADPTRYTFVVRHEPPANVEAPGVTPSDQMLASAHYTLGLFGHQHLYQRLDSKHVISGNAGAPLDRAAQNYGFLLVDQMSDGSISVTEVEAATGNPIDTWRVTADGDPA